MRRRSPRAVSILVVTRDPGVSQVEEQRDSIFTIGGLAVSDAVGFETVIRSIVLFLPNALGIWVGAKLFGKSADATYRRVALALLLIIGVVAMIA